MPIKVPQEWIQIVGFLKNMSLNRLMFFNKSPFTTGFLLQVVSSLRVFYPPRFKSQIAKGSNLKKQAAAEPSVGFDSLIVREHWRRMSKDAPVIGGWVLKCHDMS